MSTLNKLKYIKATSDKYSNLYEELIDLENTIKTLSGKGTNIEDVNSAITSLKSITNILTTEVNGAKATYGSIDERFKTLDQYTILDVFKNITTSRTYEYNTDGYITKECVRGDIEYDKTYIYNDNNDIVKEETKSLDGTSIGNKTYTYNDDGCITKVDGVNIDDVLLATNSLVDKELDERISAIEKIDIIKLMNGIQATDIKTLINTLNNLYTRVEHLEVYLPGNESSLIDLPNLRDRITTIEDKLNSSYILHTFNVTTGILEYDVPSTVNDKTSIYLEGLLLDYNDDYTLTNNKIKFNIPLIDDFTVTCKYI